MRTVDEPIGRGRQHRRRGARLLRTGAAILALALPVACDNGPVRPPSSAATSPSAAAPAPSGADAPADWPAFEQWAIERLQSFPTPVALPEPKLPESKWWLKRLYGETMMSSAKLEHGWKPDPGGDQPLAALGPFRSDQRTASFVAQRAPGGSASGADALLLSLRGFRVQREAIGAIELELATPFGREMTLKWGRAGSIVLPISSNSAPFTVRVLTDGFAEWSGPLDQFQIGISAFGPQPVELRALRFLPRANAFPEPINVSRVRLSDEIRTAIYAHAPSRITFPSTVLSRKPMLQVGLGIASDPGQARRDAGDATDSPSGAGRQAGAAESAASAPSASTAPGTAHFVITLVVDGRREVVLDEHVSADGAWHDATIALERFSGKSVQLVLHVTSPTPGTVAFWGNPILYEPVPEAPVIVLYLIDTLAGEHLQLYGYERDTAPTLTRLAKENAWFEPGLANASRTIESVPNMMLSLPTERHGVHHNSTMAAPELVTLAEMLRDAGYATASFCTNVNAGPRQGMDQGFDHFFDEIGYFWDTDGDRTVPLGKVEHWITQHADRPIFLYVHTAEPHAPYTPPDGFKGTFDADYAGSIDGSYDPQRGFHAAQARARDMQHVIALYDEEIRYADARFAAFYELLAARGLGGRAHVLVVADHGEEFLQHGHWEHGLNLHNEQTRVPFLLLGPRAAGRGRIAQAAQLFDVMPTLLDLAQLEPPYELSGASVLPALDAAPQAASRPAPDRDIFASNHNYRAQRLVEFSVVRAARWKLVFGARPVRIEPAIGGAQPVAGAQPPAGAQPIAGATASNFALYDIQADPRERKNLLAREPQLARELALALVRWREAHAQFDLEMRTAPYTSAELRGLQAMNYVGGTPE